MRWPSCATGSTMDGISSAPCGGTACGSPPRPPHRRCRIVCSKSLCHLSSRATTGSEAVTRVALSLSSRLAFLRQFGPPRILTREEADAAMFKPHWARGLVEDDVGTDERRAGANNSGSRSRGRYACRRPAGRLRVTVERLRVRDTGGGVMRLGAAQWAVVLSTATVLACGPQSPPPTPSARPQPSAATPAADGADAADENVPVPPVRSAATLQALLPSNAPRCAPTARCIRVTAAGLPQTNANAIAQCRGEFADFIVPITALPAGYAGPWFQPNLIEAAHTGVPSGTRPWRSFDPQ